MLCIHREGLIDDAAAGRRIVLSIGLVMLQGARHVHMAALRDAAEELGIAIEIHELRKASDIEQAQPSAMVIPGGESTTMRLTGNADISKLLPALFSWIRQDEARPVLATCAGAILMSEPQDGGKPLIDAQVDRNAFGSQADSFEAHLDCPLLGDGFPGVFIRAPRFTSVGKDAEVAASLDGETVGVIQGGRLALTFHPELSGDTRFHAWLLKQAIENEVVPV